MIIMIMELKKIIPISALLFVLQETQLIVKPVILQQIKQIVNNVKMVGL